MSAPYFIRRPRMQARLSARGLPLSVLMAVLGFAAGFVLAALVGVLA